MSESRLAAPCVGLEEVRAAHRRIADRVHRTPVVTCRTLDELAARQVFLKCENFQKAGAFKSRGATHALSRLDRQAAAAGVVTHSSGNHAQALALAARIRGIPAHIVMPRTAPRVKKQAVAGYGARIIECEPTLEARESTTATVQRETGAVLIPPFDHPDIIAGQGTAALELVEEVPNLDAILAPVGGGGLISGVCAVAAEWNPRIRVFAGEPSGADDAARSKQAGRIIPQLKPETIADGLLTSLGQHTWPFVRDHVERVITVSDLEIMAAMRLVWERVKIVIEPSAAVAVAAALTPDFRAISSLQRIGIILSGGNVDLDRLFGLPADRG